MMILFPNGKTADGMVLSQDGHTMRIALRDADDAMEMTNRNGMWITDECEAVTVQFEWERNTRREEIAEADCICSKELAAHLLMLLMNGDTEPEICISAPGTLTPDASRVHRVM